MWSMNYSCVNHAVMYNHPWMDRTFRVNFTSPIWFQCLDIRPLNLPPISIWLSTTISSKCSQWLSRSIIFIYDKTLIVLLWLVEYKMKTSIWYCKQVKTIVHYNIVKLQMFSFWVSPLTQTKVPPSSYTFTSIFLWSREHKAPGVSENIFFSPRIVE